MPIHRLAFPRAHSYDSGDAGIAVPIALRSGDRIVDLIAESGYATELGLDLARGVLTAPYDELE